MMRKVRVAKDTAEPIVWACYAEDASRSASINEDPADGFVVMGVWASPSEGIEGDALQSMRLATFTLEGRDRGKRKGEAIRFAIRWCRG